MSFKSEETWCYFDPSQKPPVTTSVKAYSNLNTNNHFSVDNYMISSSSNKYYLETHLFDSLMEN